MALTVPPAHVVFTTRWLIALLIRVWVLLEIVKQAPVPIDNAQRVFVEYSSQYAMIRSLGFTSGGPDYPTLNTFRLLLALVPLVICCLVYLPAAIWAGTLAKFIAPIPTGARLVQSGTSKLQHIRLTAWLWCVILLRLWSLRMIALMALPVAFVVSRYVQHTHQVLNGQKPFSGVTTVNGVIWHSLKTGVLETWVSFTTAAILWFFAGRLGRFLTTEPVTPACTSCGYRATTPTCPECGTQLTPLPQADPPAASASPPPPHQPPSASA